MNTKRKKRRVPTPVTPRPPLVTGKAEPKSMVDTPLTALSAANFGQIPVGILGPVPELSMDELSRDIAAYRRRMEGRMV